MPRLFSGLELPEAVVGQLALMRGGVVGARWLEPEDYHVTLRFIGDIDARTRSSRRARQAGARSPRLSHCLIATTLPSTPAIRSAHEPEPNEAEDHHRPNQVNCAALRVVSKKWQSAQAGDPRDGLCARRLDPRDVLPARPPTASENHSVRSTLEKEYTVRNEAAHDYKLQNGTARRRASCMLWPVRSCPRDTP